MVEINFYLSVIAKFSSLISSVAFVVSLHPVKNILPNKFTLQKSMTGLIRHKYIVINN